jgi:surface-anchored protein
MKTQNKIPAGYCLLTLAILLAAAATVRSQTVLSQGHTDIGIAYDATLNEWDMHVHDHDNDIEYSPATNALLFVKYDAHGTVPAGAQWSFLGTAGSEVWTLPSVQNPNLLFLGFGGEEITTGMFVNGQFTISLKGVSGPGTLAIYDLDSFGNPIVWMNSRDGIGGADSRVVAPGLHQDLNFAFSAPGDYTVLFEASGNSVANGLTSSGDAPYLFHVQTVPEPSVITFATAGALILLFTRRIKQR